MHERIIQLLEDEDRLNYRRTSEDPYVNSWEKLLRGGTSYIEVRIKPDRTYVAVGSFGPFLHSVLRMHNQLLEAECDSAAEHAAAVRSVEALVSKINDESKAARDRFRKELEQKLEMVGVHVQRWYDDTDSDVGHLVVNMGPEPSPGT